MFLKCFRDAKVGKQKQAALNGRESLAGIQWLRLPEWVMWVSERGVEKKIKKDVTLKSKER